MARDHAGVLADAVNLAAAKASAVDASQRLLAAALRADEPGGVSCLPLFDSRLDGLCVGSGHGLAAAHGIAAGVAVFVAIDRIAEETVSGIAGTIADRMQSDGLSASRWQERAAAVAAPQIERAVGWRILAVAAHEAAHTVALPLDTTRPTEAAAADLRALASDSDTRRDPAWTVQHHGPGWAAAYAIVAARLAAIEPDCRLSLQVRMQFDSQAVGGIDFDAVAAVVSDVPPDTAIRTLLADADFIARVSAVVPTADERLAKLSAAEGPARNSVSENSCGTAARKLGEK